jgi:hypothetical protein
LYYFYQILIGGQLIDGGNRNKPPTCRMSLTNFIK